MNDKQIKAFPLTQNISGYQVGMDLRDYFAAKAMGGLIVEVNSPVYETIAQMSYLMADAMMKERSK